MTHHSESVRVIYVAPDLIEAAQEALAAAGYSSALYVEVARPDRGGAVWERPDAVEAARLAYQEAYEADYDFDDCIAFALRAAFSFTEKGENNDG